MNLSVTVTLCHCNQYQYDPWYFELQLQPLFQSSVHLEVIVIRQDGSVPVKYGLTMEMESRHSAIKPLLARLVTKI